MCSIQQEHLQFRGFPLGYSSSLVQRWTLNSAALNEHFRNYDRITYFTALTQADTEAPCTWATHVKFINMEKPNNFVKRAVKPW